MVLHVGHGVSLSESAPDDNDVAQFHSPSHGHRGTAHVQGSSTAEVNEYLRHFSSHLAVQPSAGADAERERRAAKRKAQLQPKAPVSKGICIECLQANAELPLPACDSTEDRSDHVCICRDCRATFEEDCCEWPLHSKALSHKRCPTCATRRVSQT